MAGPLHTYGPTCLLADDDPDPSTWYSLTEPPKVRAQFFYTSSLTIDDPLSALPPQSSGQNAINERAPPQPFSVKDNIALEEAWRSLRQTRDDMAAGSKKPPNIVRDSGIPVPGKGSVNETERGHTDSRGDESLTEIDESRPNTSSTYDQTFRNSRGESNDEVGGAGDGVSWGRLQQDNVSDDHNQPLDPAQRKRELSLSRELNGAKRVAGTPSTSENPSMGGFEGGGLRNKPSHDASVSGSPFARAPITQSQSPLGRSVESVSSKAGSSDMQAEPDHTGSHHPATKPSDLKKNSVEQEDSSEGPIIEAGAADQDDTSQLKIPVGVSRLHLVELPNLKVTFSSLLISGSSGANSPIDETHILESSS